MAKIIMQKKQDLSLKPVYNNDIEKIKKLKNGSFVMIEIKQARNPKQHRLLFALLQCVLAQQEKYKSIDDLLDDLKISLGYYTKKIINNHVVIKPKSISFANMDNIEFTEKILNPALDLFAKALQCDKKALEDNYINYM